MRPAGENEEIGPELRNALGRSPKRIAGSRRDRKWKRGCARRFAISSARRLTRNVWPTVWAIAAGAVLAVVLWEAAARRHVEAPQVAQKAAPVAGYNGCSGPRESCRKSA